MHTNPQSASAMPQQAADYLAYSIAGRQYGVALHQVQELRRFDEVRGCGATPTPDREVVGAIAAQGRELAVVDLAAKLGHVRPAQAFDADVIVLNSAGRMVALAVERVIDVVTFAPDQLRTAPAIRADDGECYVAGIGRTGHRVLPLLDADRLVGDLAGQAGDV